MKQLSHTQFKKKETKKSIILVLDNVINYQNIGMILRSAYFFGITTIFVIGEWSNRTKAKVNKISKTTVNKLDIKFNQNPKDIVDFQSNDYSIIGLEMCDSSEPINTFKFNDKVVLIIGNESYGVSQGLLNICEACVHIDGFGKISSLNVAQATSIALYKMTE